MLAWTRPEPVVALLLWEGPRTLRNVYRGGTLLQYMLVGRTLRKRVDSITCNEVKLRARAGFEEGGEVTRQGGERDRWRCSLMRRWDPTNAAPGITSGPSDMTVNIFHMLPLSPPPSPLLFLLSACLAPSLSISSPSPLSHPSSLAFLPVSPARLLFYWGMLRRGEHLISVLLWPKDGGREGFLRLHVSPITPLRWQRNSLLHSATGGRERDA